MSATRPLLVTALAVLAAVAPGQPTCSWNGVGGGAGGFSVPTVIAMEVFDDGSGPSLFVGGAFTTAGGLLVNNIARWDGTTWSSVGGGIVGCACALKAFDDGSGPRLIVAGPMTAAGGLPVSGIAQWDGVTWSPLGAGVLGHVRALTVFDDGTGPALYAAGSISFAGGTPVHLIARWDGANWSPLATGVVGPTAGSLPQIRTMTTFDDGTGPQLYVGGQFAVAGGAVANGVARWNGTSWSALGSGVGGATPRVDALIAADLGDGPRLYAGGAFTLAGGGFAPGMASWNGTTWANSGSPGIPVHSLELFDDGTGAPTLFAGGGFTTVGGAAGNYIARRVSGIWLPVGTGMTPVLGAGGVWRMSVFDAGSTPSLYAGGIFTNVGSLATNAIARWDCGSTVSLSVTQASPGAPFYVNNANLTPLRDYQNLFSLEVCPVTGGGPYLGLCASTPALVQALVDQIQLPPNSPPLRFSPASSHVIRGPYPAPLQPISLQALCFDRTGDVIGSTGPVIDVPLR